MIKWSAEASDVLMVDHAETIDLVPEEHLKEKSFTTATTLSLNSGQTLLPCAELFSPNGCLNGKRVV